MKVILLTLILLTFVYFCLPKVFRVEIEIKDFFVLRIGFRVISSYVTVFCYRFPNEEYFKNKQFIRRSRRSNFKMVLKNFYNLFKIFLSVSIIKIEEVIIRICYADVFALSILSGIIYSVWGILLSYGEKIKIDYKAFSKNSAEESYFKISLKIKIFPIKILLNSKLIAKNLRGVLGYGTSN